MTPPDHAPSARRLAAIWFADIVGYTELSTQDEGAAMRLVETLQRLSQVVVKEQDGRIIKFIGDAVLAEFSSCEAAVRAAVALRGGYAAASPGASSLRIGVHVGSVVSTADGDVYGDGVNTASRIQHAALPGQILVSEDVWRQLKPLAQFSFGSPDKRRLRGMAEPVEVYELRDRSPTGAGDGLGGGVARRVMHVLGGPRRSSIVLGLLLLAAMALWGGRRGWFTFEAPAAEASLPDFDPARIAVLYFDDHSPGNQLEYLTTGLTEQLIHELTQVDELEVVSRNGVRPYRGRAVPMDSIVHDLKVGSVVEGSVTRSGDRVRVMVQLIDGATGAHVASRMVEEKQDSIVPLQDTLAQEVAGILRQSLGQNIRLRQTRLGTENGEAYELLLRARSLQGDFRTLRMTDTTAARQALLRADSLLTRAERLDRRWVDPILQRGWVARDLGMDGGGLPGLYDPAWIRVAIGHADRAIRLLPRHAAAYELRGVLKHDYSKTSEGELRRTLLREAEEDLRRAVDLDEKQARAWWTLSALLVEQARFAEGRLAAEWALEADSFLENAPVVLYHIFEASIQLGPEEDAIEACEMGSVRYPELTDFITCRLFILASFPQVEPDVDRAWALSADLVESVPDELRGMFQALGTMLVAETAARAGLADSARAIMRTARGDGPTPFWLAYNEAHARLLLGEQEAAVDLLSVFLDSMPDTVRVAEDWWFQDLQSDSAFRRVIGRRN